jgi:Flp pilus assembly protein TadG
VRNEYVTTPACEVKGLYAYGATTITTTANGRTVATQYRVSHDYGTTYTEWAAVPATITDTPVASGEYIQFRVAVTDAGTAIALHNGVSVACTFVTSWTAPVLERSIIEYAPVIGSRVVRGVNAL